MLLPIKLAFDIIQNYYILILIASVYKGEYTKLKFKDVWHLVFLMWVPWSLKVLTLTHYEFIPIIFLALQIMMMAYACTVLTKIAFIKGLSSFMLIFLIIIPTSMITSIIEYNITNTLFEYEMMTSINSVIMLIYFQILFLLFKKLPSLLVFFRTVFKKTWLLGLGSTILFFSLAILSVLKGKDAFFIERHIFSPLLTLFFVSLFIYIIQRNKAVNLQLEQHADYLNTYTLTVERMYEHFAMYKHDLSNIILSMGYLIEQKDTENLKKFFKHDLKPLDEYNLEIYRVLRALEPLKIDALKGLILNKYHSATLEGITMVIHVENTIEKVVISDLDLCRSMGFLIDQGLQNAKKSKDKTIQLKMTQKENRVELGIHTQNSSDSKNKKDHQLLMFLNNLKHQSHFKYVKNTLMSYPRTQLNFNHKDQHQTQSMALLTEVAQ